MAKVVILQGVSGSGKTRHARALSAAEPSSVIVSADDYFAGPEGYRFRPDKLGEAHGTCFQAYLRALSDGVALVVVDNTNTRAMEISPYVLGAQAANVERQRKGQGLYEVVIVRVACDPGVAAARNVHKVPAHEVLSQYGRIQTCDIPPWWKLETV